MSQSSFFPGNNLLLENASILTTTSGAKAVELQVRSDLTTMKTFKFDAWRPIIASRYAADPLVMELLFKFEASQEAIRILKAAQDNHLDDYDNSLADEPQTWQSIFQ